MAEQGLLGSRPNLDRDYGKDFIGFIIPIIRLIRENHSSKLAKKVLGLDADVKMLAIEIDGYVHARIKAILWEGGSRLQLRSGT